jgi:4-amino-4-deoxy-L-arabinose transferase-like glycosyltransferase
VLPAASTVVRPARELPAEARRGRSIRRLAPPALWIFVWSRLAIWIAAAVTVLVFESSLNPERVRWDTERLHELGRVIDVWARWDSDWYLKIAQEGYSWPSSTPAFFPLYPVLVGGLGRVLAGHYLLAGVLVSLTAGGAAFVLLHRLAWPKLGADGALRAVLYLALFPTALFLGAVYSESLFLLLAVACFVLAERKRFGLAGLAAGLALLTRPAGVALLAALALFVWATPERSSALLRAAVGPALFLLYPLTLWLWIDRPLAFLDAQETVWHRSVSPYGPLGGLWDALHDPAAAELAFLAVVVALGLHAWRRFGAPYGVYALGVIALPLAAPADGRPLLSITRFALVAFPVVLALADLGSRRWVHLATLAVSATWLMIAVVKWAQWEWVA